MVMQTLWQDVRYGLRMLAKNPGFATIAVLTLALGIGANTAIFSILDSVLLRALPVPNPGELSILTDPDAHGSSFGSEGGERSQLAYSEFQYLREHNEVFSHIFAADSQLPEVVVRIGAGSANSQARTESVHVLLVSGDYFDTLGAKPAAGRVFTPEVDRARGGAPVAVISYAFWKRRFGLDPSALERTIQVRSSSFEIVGVTQPGFFGETVGQAPDVWLPITMADAIYPGRDLLSPSPQGLLNQHLWLQAMGRRKPGITNSQANASLNLAFKRLIESLINPGVTEQARREFLDQRLKVQSAARGASTVHEAFSEPLKFLMALVGLVLLIACANVANLLLARGAARQKEFVMRLAMGADRFRLVCQLLTESLLLAILAACAGIFVAFWADSLLLRMVQGVASGPSAIQLNLQPDARVLGFTLLVTLLTTVLFGLFPSLHATNLDLAGRMKSNVSGTACCKSPIRRLPLSKALVVAQVAFSLVLLVAAGLFVHSLAKLSHMDLGYNRENLLLFRIDASAGGYKATATTGLYQDLLARISALPGMRGVTMSHDGLFNGAESADPIAVEGYTAKFGEEMHSRFDAVGPGYFSTVGIPILLGREITAQDSAGGLRAAVVNETFARRFFPNTNPIGKHIRDTYPGNPGDCVVVGVAADAKYNSMREKTPPRIYLPLFNPMWEQNSAAFEVRTFADAASVSAALRSAVQEVSPSLPPINIHTMTGLIDATLQTDRFIEQLSSAFGLLAILLAGIGLYGLMAYNVARRTSDIGIRMALGAAPGDVRWQVVRETLVLVFVGIAIGIPAALAGTRLVRSMLFGLGFADPIVVVAAAGLLAVVAVLAGFLPARRASQVDPIVALRYE
jgi:predicted permease